MMLWGEERGGGDNTEGTLTHFTQLGYMKKRAGIKFSN